MEKKIIMIASSKGGIGKSTVALRTAYALGRMHASVLLADLDFSNACLDILTGAEDSILYTLPDVVYGTASPAEASVTLQDEPFVHLLAAPVGGRVKIGAEDGIGADEAISAVLDVADALGVQYVILDTGAGTSELTDKASEKSDIALIVASHSPVSLRAAENTAERIASFGCSDTRLIINSFDTANMLTRRTRSGLFDMIDSSRLCLAGVVPEDYSLVMSEEEPKKHSASRDIDKIFENIAMRLAGKNVPLFDGIKALRKKKNRLFR